MFFRYIEWRENAVYAIMETILEGGDFVESQHFTSRDWTLFKSRIAGWQEAYIDRLNKQYIALLNADAKASDKFWELEKRIRDDRRSVGVQIEMRKSMFIPNLLSLLKDEVITLGDLDDFSDELKAAIDRFLRTDD